MTKAQRLRVAPSELAADEVHLWRIDLHPAPRIVAERRALLRPDELERADRFRSDRDRDRFTVARATLRILLGRYLALDPHDVTLAYGPHGKPFVPQTLASRACEGRELTFSLSHKGELGVVGFTTDRPIGVDVEHVAARRDIDRLIPFCLGPREAAEHEALPASEQRASFFRFWTCKEAYLKATGHGLSQAMNEVQITWVDGGPRLMHVPEHAAELPLWSLHVWEPASGFVSAVATKHTSVQPLRYEVRDAV